MMVECRSIGVEGSLFEEEMLTVVSKKSRHRVVSLMRHVVWNDTGQFLSSGRETQGDQVNSMRKDKPMEMKR